MSKSMRSFTIACVCACTMVGWWVAGTDRADAAELKAGVARVDLTPPLELKAPLGGYGERMNRPAEGTHDRIFAKALVLADGKKKFALVTVDIVGFPPPVKAELVGRLAGDGWTKEQIMLLPSHSHTSIEMNAINPANTFQVPQLGIYNARRVRVCDGAARAASSRMPSGSWCRSRSARRASRSTAGTAIAAAAT